ncbi:MAG: c-type cytochrome domain-containing protein [Planctomycetota bacterium]
MDRDRSRALRTGRRIPAIIGPDRVESTLRGRGRGLAPVPGRDPGGSPSYAGYPWGPSHRCRPSVPPAPPAAVGRLRAWTSARRRPGRPERLPLSPEAGWIDPDAQLRLAAALLSTPETWPAGPGVPTPVTSLAFRAEIENTGDALLRYILLESGAGADAVHSTYVDRLAARDDAPVDADQDGTNADETLAALRAEYAFRTNGQPLDALAPSFLLPALVPDHIVGKPANRRDWAALRAVADPTREQWISPAQLGSLMRAAASRASALLRYGRGDLYGATAEEGQLGLLLLEQAVLADSLLLDSLSFDGRSLGAFEDPGAYDPEVQPRLFPARIVWRRDAGDPRRPEALRLIDRGSDLRDQARLLRGFVELAFLASPEQTHPLLGRLFRGDPFGRPDLTPSALEGPEAETISWDKHVRGLLSFYCAGCHAGTKPEAGFSIETYSLALKGGVNQATNPIVVKGDHAKSLLWQVVALEKPPISKRMPDGGPYLGQIELDLIADWIDQGLIEKDPGLKDRVITPGVDGMRIVLANLAHFHRDPATKLLVERADFAGGRSTMIRPGPVGETLKALSVCAKAFPDEKLALELLEGMAQASADRLVGPGGEVWESYDLGTGAHADADAEIGDAASLFGGLYAAASVLGQTPLIWRLRPGRHACSRTT